MSDPTRVLFVCLGNICRSPMAEGMFHDLVRQRGLADRFVVESAGTAAYHTGERPDRRTLEVLERHGIRLDSLARRVELEDFAQFDFILAMDASNLSDLRRRCPEGFQDKLYRVLDPVGGGDVPDPYYGGPAGFDQNYEMLSEALDAWLERMG